MKFERPPENPAKDLLAIVIVMIVFAILFYLTEPKISTGGTGHETVSRPLSHTSVRVSNVADEDPHLH